MALTLIAGDRQWRREVAEAFGGASLATTATTGFFWVPTCAGTPTGIPVAQPGQAPLIVDETNNRLYFYSSGAWRNAGP